MNPSPEAQDLNKRLLAEAPQVFEALSLLARRAYFPKGIPYQAGQAAGCAIDATIGQITDGHGNPIPLARLGELLEGLKPKDAFLYSPIQGRPKARQLWREKLVKEDARIECIGLPVVTAGICHAISMAAELFFERGDTLLLPDLYWDNYEQIFGISQYLMEEELLDPRHDESFEAMRQILERRYRILKNALSKPTGQWIVYPFNAGCFCLLELRSGLHAEDVRQRLITEESVGVVNQSDRHIRLAFCSLREAAIEPLVAALERVCRKMK